MSYSLKYPSITKMCHLKSYFSVSSFPPKAHRFHQWALEHCPITPHIQPDTEDKETAKYAFLSVVCSLETAQCFVTMPCVHIRYSFLSPFIKPQIRNHRTIFGVKMNFCFHNNLMGQRSEYYVFACLRD